MAKSKRKPEPIEQPKYHSDVVYNKYLFKIGKQYYMRLMPVPYIYLKPDCGKLKTK